MKLNSKIRNDKDNFYLEVINPVTNKKELKQLDLVKDTIEIEEPLENEIIINIPQNDYYFKFK
jgi:hypothetical protein